MSASVPVGVLVVDDQPIFREVAREVIGATEEFEVRGEATSGADALAVYDELEPDLVLLDVRMPELDGVETATRLHALHPAAVIVLISVDVPVNLPAGLSACGAAEFVRKQDFGPALLRRVWQAHGRPMQSPASDEGADT
jgi:DNA-binding NarL/FixJ family response regulator